MIARTISLIIGVAAIALLGMAHPSAQSAPLPTTATAITSAPLPSPDILQDMRPRVKWFGEEFRENLDGTLENGDGTVWRSIRAATTAYSWSYINSVEPGVTAARTDARVTFGYATDWRAVPRGSVLWVPGYGRHRVDDKCGAAQKDWKRSRSIRIDLRIPNQGPTGTWRSNSDAIRIATAHGYQTGRTILLRVK